MHEKRKLLTKLLRLGVNDADVIEKIMKSDDCDVRVAKDDEEGVWRTLENGVHVQIGKGGEIQKGPGFMKGKTTKEVSRESKARNAAKVASKPAAIKSKTAGKSTGSKAAVPKEKKENFNNKAFTNAYGRVLSANSNEERQEGLTGMFKEAYPGTELMFEVSGDDVGIARKNKNGTWSVSSPDVNVENVDYETAASCVTGVSELRRTRWLDPDNPDNSGSKEAKQKARNEARSALNKLRKSTATASADCKKKAQEWPDGSEEREIYTRYADIMSKPQPGRPTPEDSKAMTKKFLGNISSKLKPYAVERYKKDLANEPAITKDICDIADELGTEMFGLNYRLKKASDSSDGHCRIADKISEDMNDKKNPMTYEQAVDKLSDQVRYTQACTPENLASNYNKTRKLLEKKGYKLVKTKNTWDSFSIDKPYRGVNCVFESPTGTKFELQFHTPDSLVAKEVQHPQYEEQRKPETTPVRFKELGEIMYNNQKGLKRPKGIEQIKNYP